MAIYLFILLSLGLVFDVITLTQASSIGVRIGTLLGIAITIPPYIWYGWYSGLIY